MKISQVWQIAVLFLLITIGIFYFVFPDISTHVLGDKYNDVWVSCWHIWWDKVNFGHIIKADFYTDKIFYPRGVNVHRHIPILLTDFFAIPFTYLFSIPASYNLLILVLFFSNCIAMYYLAKYLTDNKYAGFISGIVYGVNAYVFGQIYNGTLETVNLAFLPLYLLILLRLIDTNHKKYILFSSLTLFLATLSCWYYGFYLVVLTLLYILTVVVNKAFKSVRYKKTFLFCVLALILYFVAISPFAYSLIKRTILAKTTMEVYRSQLDFIVDIKDFFKPGKLILEPDRRYFMKSVYIGYGCLILCLLAFLSKYRKEVIKWFFLGVFFFILTLGCHLSLFGHIFYNFYLPSKFLPIINTYRAFSICLLIIAIISGYGTVYLIEKVKKVKHRIMLTSIIAIAIIAEVLFISPAPYPLPMADMRIPAIYHRLAQDKNNYAIIDIPFNLYNHLFCGRYMYYQTLHKKAIPYGVSYLSPNAKDIRHWAYIKDNAFLNLIVFDLYKIGYISETNVENLVEACNKLKADGFRYILVHNEYLNDDIKIGLKQLLSKCCILVNNANGQITLYKLK